VAAASALSEGGDPQTHVHPFDAVHGAQGIGEAVEVAAVRPQIRLMPACSRVVANCWARLIFAMKNSNRQ
jgi:hypothetical protein